MTLMPILQGRYSAVGTSRMRTVSTSAVKYSYVALLLLAGSLTVACKVEPGIEYRHLPDEELVQQSPVIVLGTVDRLAPFWHERVPHGSENGEPLHWFHVEVQVRIENVLKGEVSEPSLNYAYWLPVGAKVGQWNSPGEGGRYIHFLRRRGRQFRSVVDFWPSSFRVTTGRHRGVPPGNGLPQQIAQLLLIPRDGFASDHFDLPSAYVHGRGLIGWSPTLALVQPFANSSDPGIRKTACDVLNNGGTPWNKPCLH